MSGRGPKIWTRVMAAPPALPIATRVVICARTQERGADLLAACVGAAAAPDRLRMQWRPGSVRDFKFVRGREGVWCTPARPFRQRDYREMTPLRR